MTKKRYLYIVSCLLFIGWCIYFFTPLFPLPQHKVDTSKETVHIYFNINDNYAKYLAVTLASILENTDSPLHFYVLHSGVSEENQNKIRQLKKIRDFDIDFIKFSEEKFKTFRTTTNAISKDAMMRLYVSDYIHQTDKILYLDSDMIITSDIAELYYSDIEDYALAAVQDPIVYTKSFTLPKNAIYVNSGMMLINLAKWSEENVTHRFEKIYRQYFSALVFPDQDIINIAFAGKIKPLPVYFNYIVNLSYIPADLQNIALDDIRIIHWAGKPKPWETFTAKNKDIFWEYAESTPFYTKLRSIYLLNSLIFIKNKVVELSYLIEKIHIFLQHIQSKITDRV